MFTDKVCQAIWPHFIPCWMSRQLWILFIYLQRFSSSAFCSTTVTLQHKLWAITITKAWVTLESTPAYPAQLHTSKIEPLHRLTPYHHLLFLSFPRHQSRPHYHTPDYLAPVYSYIADFPSRYSSSDQHPHSDLRLRPDGSFVPKYSARRPSNKYLTSHKENFFKLLSDGSYKPQESVTGLLGSSYQPQGSHTGLSGSSYKHEESPPRLPYKQQESPPRFSYEPQESTPRFPYEHQESPLRFPYEHQESPPRYPYEHQESPQKLPYEPQVSPHRLPYEHQESAPRFPYEHQESPQRLPYEPQESLPYEQEEYATNSYQYDSLPDKYSFSDIVLEETSQTKSKHFDKDYLYMEGLANHYENHSKPLTTVPVEVPEDSRIKYETSIPVSFYYGPDDAMANYDYNYDDWNKLTIENGESSSESPDKAGNIKSGEQNNKDRKTETDFSPSISGSGS